MNLLRFLLLLPIRLLGVALRIALFILGPFVGEVSWSAPAWMSAIGSIVRRKPLHVAATIALSVAALYGWRWYEHRPKPAEPDQVTFKVNAPERTTYAASDGRSVGSIHPLDVSFSHSVAPLEQIGKTAGAGISMKSALKGEWLWANDRTLRFTPATEWPIGAHISVSFDPAQALKPNVLMAADHFEFDIAPFRARVASAEFNQSPVNPASKHAIAQIAFDYPVDPVSFEKRIVMALIDRSGSKPKPLRFSVTYGDAYSSWREVPAFAVYYARLALDPQARPVTLRPMLFLRGLLFGTDSQRVDR